MDATTCSIDFSIDAIDRSARRINNFIKFVRNTGVTRWRHIKVPWMFDCRKFRFLFDAQCSVAQLRYILDSYTDNCIIAQSSFMESNFNHGFRLVWNIVLLWRAHSWPVKNAACPEFLPLGFWGMTTYTFTEDYNLIPFSSTITWPTKPCGCQVYGPLYGFGVWWRRAISMYIKSWSPYRQLSEFRFNNTKLVHSHLT